MYHLPIDPMLLIVGFSVLSVVLLIAVIVCIVKMNKLYRRYDLFMRGKDAETLEDTLEDILEELKGEPVQGPGQQGRYETAVQAGKGFIPEIWICQI